jgi:hypothetical protein
VVDGGPEKLKQPPSIAAKSGAEQRNKHERSTLFARWFGTASPLFATWWDCIMRQLCGV